MGQSRLAQGIPGLETRCRGIFGGGRRISPDLDPAGLCGDGDGVSSGELVLMYIRAGYARRFGDTLSFGVSPILVVESFKARGLSAFDDYSVAPGHVSDRGHPKAPSLGVGGRIGALWSPVENLTLGASWQSKIAVGRFDSYEGVILAGGRIDSPEMWNAGLALRPARRHLLAADFERIEFSDIPVLGRRFNAPAFAERCLLPRLLLDAEPSSACLGGDLGPGFGWTDTRSYKLGYRYSPTADLAFGLGYAWTRRPVHGDQALFNILAPAVTNDHFAGGVSWRMRPGLTLNIATLYAPRRSVSGRNPLSHIDATALASGPTSPSAGSLFGTDPLDQEIRIAAEVVEVIFGVQIGF